jgi:hypothetical protein
MKGLQLAAAGVSRRRRTGLGLALSAVAVVAMGAPAARAACTGDCDGSGGVTINELILAVNIALGDAPVSECSAIDRNGDGSVTIDELVAAVDSALDGCSATPTPTIANGLLIMGDCEHPGPHGLQPCAPGTQIVVWRCDDPVTCIKQVAARSLLGDGAVDTEGSFAITVDATAAGHAALLMEASVSDATLFRTLDFGSVGGGAAVSGRASDVAMMLSVTIDPSSEAAVQLIDQHGLDQFDADGVRAVIAAVQAANASTDFAGLSDDAAAAKAFTVAEADPGVQQALAIFQFTPTPTATDSAPPTATSTATETPTPPATASATPTVTPTSTTTPYLQALLTTDRGCLETGDSPTYTLGEEAYLTLRAVGASGGMQIAHVDLKLSDYSNGQLVSMSDLGANPTGVTFHSHYVVQPPTGTEMLVLLADAAPIPLMAQAQCSFNVAPCASACDCPPGEQCTAGGVCATGPSMLYCCTNATCPMNADCQFPNGGFGTCG